VGETEHWVDGTYNLAGTLWGQPYWKHEAQDYYILFWGDEGYNTWAIGPGLDFGCVVEGWVLNPPGPTGIYQPGPFVEGTVTVSLP